MADAPAAPAASGGHPSIQAIADELAAAGLTDAHEIGRGGFGVVFRCTQAQLGRAVAVKVLSAVLDHDNFERFHREEFVMGRLSGHPNIATVLQIGALATGQPYIVMPFYPDDSLDALIRHRGASEWAWAARIGVKLAGALETAHRSGILHRDVKPANILLTEYGEPQLTDFGIAHIAGGFETSTGNIAGSLGFTAPEVLEGATPSAGGDVYSLGATLFNLIGGKPAFAPKPGEQLVAQFLRFIRQPTPTLDVPEVPADVRDALGAAMSRDPAARPGSAAEFGELLAGLLREHGLPTPEMVVLSGSRTPDGSAPAPTPRSPDTGPSTQAAVFTDFDDEAPAPPRSALPAARRLPVPLTSFIGRDDEVADIIELLTGDARLVTLTGPGGVGKTRLALEVATRLSASVPGGVWQVELGGVLDTSHLIDVIADALALGDQQETGKNTVENLAGRLAKSMGARRMLIVLENCEHLIADCARLIEPLLQALPDLQLLVTSQHVLGIPGEHIYVVSPLPCPDPDEIGDDPAASDRVLDHPAVQLFVERAGAVVRGFSMTDEDRLNVARLCAQLDGIPLLIELAAARLRTFSVAELLQVMADRFRLLSTGGGTIEPRHRTLQALVDWGFNLLTPDEREVWLAAALFTDDFTADAAIEVCTGPGRNAQDVRIILASLVDKSMVASALREGRHRYRLLATLRDYAVQRLIASGHRDETVQRYISRYRRLTEEFRRDWFSTRQVEVFTAVHEERKNLRAALTYCQADGRLSASGCTIVTSLYYYWLASTTLTEGRRWLGEVIDSTEANPPIRAFAVWIATTIAFLQTDFDAIRWLARTLDEIVLPPDDQACSGYLHLARGLMALCRGEFEHGLAEYRQALECERAIDNPEGIVDVASGLVLLQRTGDTADEPALWHEAVALCEQAGDRWHLAYLMNIHGYHRYEIGDYDAAWEAGLTTLRLSAPFADRIVVAYALERLSWIAVRRGDFENAAQLSGAAAASWDSDHGAMSEKRNIERHEVAGLLRSALGTQRTEQLISDGRAIGPDKMVALILAGQ